jgi:hypothetical protein
MKVALIRGERRPGRAGRPGSEGGKEKETPTASARRMAEGIRSQGGRPVGTLLLAGPRGADLDSLKPGGSLRSSPFEKHPRIQEDAMSRKKISSNDPCPCGSGKTYKACCYNKGFEWQEDDQGGVYKSVPMTDEVADVVRQQREKFIAKYGREPGPDDLLFFDAPPVEQVEFQMVQAMKKAGINPAIIYAFEKTDGLLVTEENKHLISDKDLDAWQAAIEEYEAKRRGRGESGRY